MILFRVWLRVFPADRERVVKSILRLVGPTRAMRGCTACGVFVDIEDDNSAVYVEEWESQAALDTHMRMEAMKVLLSVMDLASEPPVVRFDTISTTSGIEVIVTARRGLGSPGEGTAA